MSNLTFAFGDTPFTITAHERADIVFESITHFVPRYNVIETEYSTESENVRREVSRYDRIKLNIEGQFNIPEGDRDKRSVLEELKTVQRNILFFNVEYDGLFFRNMLIKEFEPVVYARKFTFKMLLISDVSNPFLRFFEGVELFFEQLNNRFAGFVGEVVVGTVEVPVSLITDLVDLGALLIDLDFDAAENLEISIDAMADFFAPRSVPDLP